MVAGAEDIDDLLFIAVLKLVPYDYVALALRDKEHVVIRSVGLHNLALLNQLLLRGLEHSFHALDNVLDDLVVVLSVFLAAL